jgi:hypothetical protein
VDLGCGCSEWIQLLQYRGPWQALVNTVIKPWILVSQT